MKPTDTTPIRIINPRKLDSWLWPAERITVGIPGDYKPSLALLPTGELLMIGLWPEELADNRVREWTTLWRSSDGGKTWSERQLVQDMLGREQWLTCTRDGTLFATSHFLPQDINNQRGVCYSFVHRSTDSGQTWQRTEVFLEGAERGGMPLTTGLSGGGHTSRNLVEMPDGTLLLGVSIGMSSVAYLWSSRDGGKTWHHGEPVRINDYKGKPYDNGDGFFAEDFTFPTRSGKLLHWIRCGPPSLMYPMNDGRTTPDADDSGDRTIRCESTDGGRTWTNFRDFGNYGMMYVRVLRLQDGRLLLNYTQRAIYYPIGLRALISDDDGETWDFDHDLLIIDGKTPWGMASGGGFGNTVQLADSTLVSAYTYRGADGRTHLEVVRWAVPRPRAMTPFVRNWRVSSFLPSAGKLENLQFPRNQATLDCQERTFADDFCDLHPEIEEHHVGDALVYFACVLDCAESMKLTAWMGYDGPVKVWLDGRLTFHDPNGTNPGTKDQAAIPLDAPAGRREFLVAWSSNQGKAWGLFLRFERTDLPLDVLTTRQWHARLPVIRAR